jgi:hypothetical protein
MGAGEAICTTKNPRIYCPDSSSPTLSFSAIGDIHYGVRGHSKARFEATLGRVKRRMAKSPNHYTFFIGDQTDKFSDSERKSLFGAALHAGSVDSIDEWMVTGYLEPLAKRLAFLGDHNLGFIQGNHTYIFQTNSEQHGYSCGMSAEQWLAQRLNTHWLGWICYMRLSIYRGCGGGKCSGASVPLDFVICHGKGGGKLAGSTINGVDDLRRIFPSAHCYFAGHDHQLGVVPVSMLEVPMGATIGMGLPTLKSPAHLRIRTHDQLLCRCGSHLKAYEPGVASYVVRSLMRPACLGHVEVFAKLERTREDDRRHLAWHLEGVVVSGSSRASIDPAESEGSTDNDLFDETEQNAGIASTDENTDNNNEGEEAQS